MRSRFWIAVLFVLALRAPFLGLAVQGDDYYYLTAAQHAQIDPAHPLHARFVFLGNEIDMRGHTHPPGNSWWLALLLRMTGDVRETVFHTAYLLLSLLAAGAIWRLAGVFAPHVQLWATLLFCAVPAFVVNGASLEADLPHLAFWTAAAAAFVERRLAAAFLFWSAAALFAYQAVILAPILAVYLWLHRRQDRASWMLLATPFAVAGGYQIFERLTSGALPAQVLAGHFTDYALQSLVLKGKHVAALCGHLAVMLSPLGLLALLRPKQPFLLAWIALFFAAAAAGGYAGSARYLLPLAAPFALLVALRFAARPALLGLVLACQLTLGLGLAWVNADHWNAYRRFVAEHYPAAPRVWVNAEWGLRHYAEAAGARALRRSDTLWPGDYLITSDLAERFPLSTSGGQLTLMQASAVQPRLPLRLIGPGTGSGYSSVAYGLWPFGWSRAPQDTIRLYRLVERKPELSWLPMKAAQTEFQILAGAYALENGEWRWVAGRSEYLLKEPAQAMPLAAEIYIPDQAPARRVRLELDGRAVAEQQLPGPGRHVVTSPAVRGGRVTLVIEPDFQPPNDQRRLGAVLMAIGFR